MDFRADNLTQLVLADLDTLTVTIGPPKAYHVDSVVQPLALIYARRYITIFWTTLPGISANGMCRRPQDRNMTPTSYTRIRPGGEHYGNDVAP